MHATKRALQNWIYAIYTVVTARNGVSAQQLSTELGIQYSTAWHMLHRVREACDRGDFMVREIVVIDETYISGEGSNKHESKKLHAGRGTMGKVAVVGVRECGGKVKTDPVGRTDAQTLIRYIEGLVEAESSDYTGDVAAYEALPSMINQYQHETVAHGKGEYVRDDVHTNGIEAVMAVLRRSIHSSWHHVSPKHLGRYVNETSFRLKESNYEIDTIDRRVEFATGFGGKQLRYIELISNSGESVTPVAV